MTDSFLTTNVTKFDVATPKSPSSNTQYMVVRWDVENERPQLDSLTASDTPERALYLGRQNDAYVDSEGPIWYPIIGTAAVEIVASAAV